MDSYTSVTPETYCPTCGSEGETPARILCVIGGDLYDCDCCDNCALQLA